MNRVVIALAVAVVVLTGTALWVSARYRIDPRAPADVAEAVWRDRLRALHASVAAGDGVAAIRAWHDAWQASVQSCRWDAEIAVGDAALLLGKVVTSYWVAMPDARQVYRAALIRARAQASFEGIVRAGQAFAALGDVEVAHAAFETASSLAVSAQQRDELARVRGELGATHAASDPVVGDEMARGRARFDAPRMVAQ